MKGRWRTLLAARDGVVAMEFAVLAVPLMLFTLGTIEFGRLLWTQEAIESAATQVARCIGVRASSCASGGAYSASNARTYAESVATGWGVTLTDADVTLSASEGSGACTGLSQVSINYTFTSVVPGLLSMFSQGAALTAQACFPNRP